MKILGFEVEEGRLECWNCVHCDDCEKVNKEGCVANYLYEGKTVHLVEKIIKKE